MIARAKQQGFDIGGGKPVAQGSWIYGLVVGMAVSNLAAGAVMLGTGAAIRNAIVRKPRPAIGGRRG